MGTMRWVRHGQASFGAADYDVLSPLGVRQCERLGEHWAAAGWRPTRVWRGTLRRHAQSLAAIERGMGVADGVWPTIVWPGLDEYDSDALLAALNAIDPAGAPAGDDRRAHFRRLRTALQRWSDGELVKPGRRDWPQFKAGVAHVLAEACAHQAADEVLVVSSGGPIATMMGEVLGLPAATVIDLNLRLRNSAVTELATTPRRAMLVSFNALPHLDEASEAALVTHA